LAIAAACFLAGVIVCWRWTHREPRVFSYTLAVTSVENGATLAVQHGLLGRKTRLVMIEGLRAPGLNDPLGRESQDNLKSLAGGTIRVESEDRPIGTGTIVGKCFGDTGTDLGLAQLRAGLATCETAAKPEQLAAQKEAQRAKRGLWSKADAGSRWWHFSAGMKAASIPEPNKTNEEKPSMFSLENIGNLLLIVVALIILAWIVAYFAGGYLQKTAAGKAALSAIDTTAEVAAYAALTGVRYMPGVKSDPKAVESCEYLLTAVMKWPPENGSNTDAGLP